MDKQTALDHLANLKPHSALSDRDKRYIAEEIERIAIADAKLLAVWTALYERLKGGNPKQETER